MRVRVGVIGLGYAGETHLKSYRAVGGVEPVALAGLEPERLKQLASAYAVPDVHDQWEDLVAREDLDAISVCAPNYLHAPIALAALSSGKHVLCEKPLARTRAEAAAMVAAAVENDRVLHTAFNHRERGDVAALKRYAEEGSLGRIYHAKASWMRRWGIPSAGTWFTSKEMAGGGPLIDLGVHVLDMGLHLMGEPTVVSVTAAAYTELGPRRQGRDFNPSASAPFEVEDLASAFLRFDDGSTLLLEAAWAAHGRARDDFGVTLFGTDGGADIKVENYSWQDTLTIYTNVAGAPAEVRPVLKQGEGHLAVVRAFVEAVRGERGPWSAHRGDVGLHRTTIIDACYRSAVEGREVVLTDKEEVA